MSHTPGPWTKELARSSNGIKVWQVYGPNPNEWVAECGWGGNAEACALLIAASPDLLKALKAALAWIDAVPPSAVLPVMPGFDRDAVNDLLAKAEGK